MQIFYLDFFLKWFFNSGMVDNTYESQLLTFSYPAFSWYM